MNDKEQEKREELFAETRRDLLTRQLSNSERFDGAVLALSTGALGFSLTFLKDVVPIEKAQNLLLLIISWWLFGLAIISTLASFVASQLGIMKQLNYAQEYYINRKNEYLTKPNVPAKVTDFLNYASGLLFVAAVVLTITFVSTNV